MAPQKKFINKNHTIISLEYCQGGDLQTRLKKAKKLDDSTSRFYAVNVLLALKALHDNDILYREYELTVLFLV